mmetsp:Transcript_57405/g.136442  ORF Transcript_57405/g.136442 Transcript_57405/m.136442 type:complete len:117 (+) Transcript_57405:99-449(+)
MTRIALNALRRKTAVKDKEEESPVAHRLSSKESHPRGRIANSVRAAEVTKVDSDKQQEKKTHSPRIIYRSDTTGSMPSATSDATNGTASGAMSGICSEPCMRLVKGVQTTSTRNAS